jgi:hypothetical protein
MFEMLHLPLFPGSAPLLEQLQPPRGLGGGLKLLPLGYYPS